MEIAKPTGYQHASFVESLSEWGKPRRLASAGSWAMEREIPGSARVDASGCYPLMACERWGALEADLEDAGSHWVSFTAVPDPLGAPAEVELRRIFRDVVRPFKTHYVVDLKGWTGPAKAQHRTRVRRAAAQVEIEVAPARHELVEVWCELYAELVSRHAIRGMQAFSRRAFAQLFAVPGTHVARSLAGQETVAMSLWVTHGSFGYSHLTASSPRGYELSAAYPMVDAAIRYFKQLGFSLLDLGGVAGVSERSDSGLASFKSGWTTAERTAWLCGRILDSDAYRALSDGSPSHFFPAYRAGEFL